MILLFLEVIPMLIPIRSKYMKILFIISLVMIILMSSAISVHARRLDSSIPVFDFIDGVAEVEQPIIYNNRELSIKGKALEGTVITINTYWYQVHKVKTIILKDKLNQNDISDTGEWILQHTEECQVGLSGIFGASVPIKPGRNKVVVESDTGESYEIELEYIDNRKITEKIFSDMFDRVDLIFE